MATNLALPLQSTPGARQSRLFQSFPPTLMRALQSQSLTFNSHDHGLLVSEYESTPALYAFFEMLSFDETPAGQLFVSTCPKGTTSCPAGPRSSQPGATLPAPG